MCSSDLTLLLRPTTNPFRAIIAHSSPSLNSETKVESFSGGIIVCAKLNKGAQTNNNTNKMLFMTILLIDVYPMDL